MEKYFKIIDEKIANGETLYGVNVHGIGFEFRLGSFSIEEIIGNKYFVYIDRQCTKLTKEQHKQISDYLNPIWEKQGKKWQARGLY